MPFYNAMFQLEVVFKYRHRYEVATSRLLIQFVALDVLGLQKNC